MSLDENSLQSELTLEERAQKRLQFKEQKRQKNIENITQKAANNLEKEGEVSNNPVDKDWITRFFSYAEDISDEEMQELWARILAGEVERPKSYSLRTLDVLRNLSREEADVFMKFAALNIKSSEKCFILNFKNEALLKYKYGLNFNDRLLLEELGIITANDLQLEIKNTGNNPQSSVFKIGNTIVIQHKEANKPKQLLEVLVFTKIGQQLLNLVKTSPNLDYIQLLASKLNRQNGLIQYRRILEYLSDGNIRPTPFTEVPLTEDEAELKRKQEEDKNS